MSYQKNAYTVTFQIDLDSEGTPSVERGKVTPPAPDWLKAALTDFGDAVHSRYSTGMSADIVVAQNHADELCVCLLYTSPSPRDS